MTDALRPDFTRPDDWQTCTHCGTVRPPSALTVPRIPLAPRCADAAWCDLRMRELAREEFVAIMDAMDRSNVVR